ncbi:MAG: hypothetical protein JWQ09_41 [Segetibacter sp.]|nr:hypothetical protein [Segetibacter sp.]
MGFYCSNMRLFSISLLLIFFNLESNSQICGTPGLDGPSNNSTIINTYYPVLRNVVLNPGSNNVVLDAVPPIDSYGNSFGNVPISAGDMILIIQMQDAEIDATNSNLYGSGLSNSGPDGLGGTGFLNIGNSGLYEYVVATNNVPLTGGIFNYKGCNGNINTYVNADPTFTRGKRTFQCIRIPQFSNLTLTSNITTPPFKGRVGGIIAFNVARGMDFNGFAINGTARGFRGGYGPVNNAGPNNASVYVVPSTSSLSSGKGEGIAGTPRYMWDGFNQADNILEGLAGGSFGRGAPATAGGGGNDCNSGGGGGGNGGFGGVGGIGVQHPGGDLDPLSGGGRMGFHSYSGTTPEIERLIMGGGGGGGDANDALNGVKGGAGGAIIIINAGYISSGTIISNGGDGQPGAYGIYPDGAGGGGAGGSILINVQNSSPISIVSMEANGGKGGNTLNDDNSTIGLSPHGPGGGGGGGIISYNIPDATVSAKANGGLNGITNNGAGISHGAKPGTPGFISTFNPGSLPPCIQSSGNLCLPELITSVILDRCTTTNSLTFSVLIKNIGAGNAGAVELELLMATATFQLQSALPTYFGNAVGPSVLSNTGSLSNPKLGTFNIPQNDSVKIIVTVLISGTTAVYHIGAQSLYLDPTRTVLNPDRKITAFVNSFGNVNTNYELVIGGKVAGANSYDNIGNFVTFVAPPTGSANQTFCSPNIYTIQDLDVMGSSSYPSTLHWYSTSTGGSSLPMATSLISGNTYHVSQTVNACESLRLPVTVTIHPKPDLGSDVPVGMCLGSYSDLTSLFVATGLTTSWTIDGVTVPNPSAVTAAGIYQLVVANIYGCMDTGLVTISLKEKSISTINQTICEGQSFLGYTTSGIYSDILRAVNGCDSIRTLNLSVVPLPTPDAGSDTTICPGRSVQLNGSGGREYIWLPSTYLNSAVISNPVANPPQTITYSLSVKNANGCVSLKKDYVTINVLQRKVSLGADTVIVVNQPLQLHALDINNSMFNQYSWTPVYGLDNPLSQNPIATVDRDITYTVTASTAEGCTATDDINIKVFKEVNIYVPTAFTPNGDGKNDVIRPIAAVIGSIQYFRIYNRWGKMVFSTTVNGQGWDGNIAGKRQGTNTYVWELKGIDFRGRPFLQKGTVTLIR